MGLINFIINILDPFGVIRANFFKPLREFTFSMYDHYRNKTKDKVVTVRDLILRFGIVSFAVAIIIWSAVFMYVAFYYLYIPTIAHTRPVHMQFKTCLNAAGICSFPQAHVSLTKKQQLLMVGQAYKILVNIDMPESPQNQDLGMFMVCADMRDNKALLRGHSCRSAMLRYRSPLLRAISTWVLSPLLIFGFYEELQHIPVELFSNYEEEQMHPVTDVYVEIQSQKIQFYSVTLHITADFTGLRYIMFHWPVLSAALGISTNLFFILIVFILSWYHWSDTTWLKEAREKYTKKLLEETKSKMDISLSSFDDDILEDDDEYSLMAEKSKTDIEDINSESRTDLGVATA
ncbi:seipin [Condylostylus longicornis]|uniref:seipin n=1 Tax=Condylostylus longicornis TaxID=2530218 RepID=UPI00244E20D7|nr:seipin [Condylostylus longicornis]